jgi:enterochelin esterase-like enzyme
MLKSLLVVLTICLLVPACQPVNQNGGAVAGAVFNGRILPTAISTTTKGEERSFARPQDDSSFARPQDDSSFAKPQDDNSSATPQDNSSVTGSQGGKLSAQSQVNTPSPTPTSTPTATVSPTPVACTETVGTVVAGQIATDLLPAPMNFRVYLPPCYSDSPSVRYPVLYMLHGMNNNDEQWIRIGATKAADILISTGQAPPFLIVMPQEDNWAVDADDTNYGKALVTALMPWIDQHYPTCADRLCRAIGGLSRGSGWAIRLGFTYPDMFSSIGAHSLSPFYGDYDDLPNWLGAIPAASAPRLYIDIGNADISLGFAKLFEGQITKLNFAHEWHIFDGGHNEAYWSAHVMDYLKWYTQPWNASQ